MTEMKRALVTGGSGDIGSAICKRLADQGLAVIVHANSRLEKAEAIAADIQAAGGQAQAVAFDVSDTAACATALQTLLADGPIQVAWQYGVVAPEDGSLWCIADPGRC